MKKHIIASMLLSCFAVSTQATAATDLQYHFSNSLLTSIRNCNKYNEEFNKINPDLADMDATCQRFDIKINGILTDNLCHATITHKTQNHGKTTYRCKLTRSQRNELYNAIMTRSAEPITSTFTVFEEYEDEQGNTYREPTIKTMTDSLINITLEKLRLNACEATYEEPTPASQQQFAEYILTFSDNFQKKLQTCTPAQEYIRTPYLTKPIKIIGKEANTCVIDSSAFIYHIPMSEIYKLTNYDQLSVFATDPQIAQYSPSPDLKHTLFALDACQKEEEYSSSIFTQMINAIQITKQTTANNQDHDCVIKYREEVSRPDYYEEYETVCVFPDSEVADLISPYQKVLASSSRIKPSPAAEKAGTALYKILDKRGYCKLNSL